MLKKKELILIVFLFLFVISFSKTVFAVSYEFSFDSTYDYISDETKLYRFILTVDSDQDPSELPRSIPIRFSSSKQNSTVDSFAYIDSLSEAFYVGTFKITEGESVPSDTTPIIGVNKLDNIFVNLVNEYDVVVLLGDINVDLISPIIQGFAAYEGNDYLDEDNKKLFFSNTLKLNFNPASDDSPILYDILYVIETKNLDTYSKNYVERYVIERETSSSSQFIIDTTEFEDKEYYILLDAQDIAGNYATPEDVKNNRLGFNNSYKIFIDNSEPKIIDNSLINLKIIDDEYYYYTNNSLETLEFEFTLEDLVGVDYNSLNLQAGIQGDSTNPLHIADLLHEENVLNIKLNKIIDPKAWRTNEIIQITFSIKDYLKNSLEFEFKIVVDLDAPPTPDFNISINDNKEVKIIWNEIIDNPSGVIEYKVYKDTKDFTSITNQTLVCTLDANSTRECEDKSQKSLNTDLYYALTATDYAGNTSAFVTKSVNTGPYSSIKIENNPTYTKVPTLKFIYDYSDDVNLVSFSCNNTSFTKEMSLKDLKEYSFDITKGSGCSSANGEKIIYFKVKSKNKPYLTSVSSTKIIYDSKPPSVPKNLEAQTQSNGSIKLSWDASEDEFSKNILYKIYYSDVPMLNKESDYVQIKNNKQYNFAPNVSALYYFKISATDDAGNESNLSSEEVSAISEKKGPTFSLKITPFNQIEDELYVGGGETTFVLESDQELSKDPTLTLKIGKVTKTLEFERVGKTITFNYTFEENEEAELIIKGENTLNEESEDSFEFLIDVDEPEYEVLIEETEGIFNFSLEEYSSDIFNVQYFLNDNEEICFVEDDQNNYLCVFDSHHHDDKDYTIYVYAYDKALNVTTKQEKIVVKNRDLEYEESVIYNKELIKKAKDFEANIKVFKGLNIDVDEECCHSLEDVFTRLSIADDYFHSSDYNKSYEEYLEIEKELNEINSCLPEINIEKESSFKTFYDENKMAPVYKYIKDENVLLDTKDLYDSDAIVVDRGFVVEEIDGLKFLSVTLSIKNTSQRNQTLTMIEEIPKTFAADVSSLIFNKEINVLLRDPIISYNFTLAPNEDLVLVYKNNKKMSDVDVATKYPRITFTDPVIVSGNIDPEEITIVKPLNTKILIWLVIALFGFLVLLVIIGLVYKSKKDDVIKKTIKPTKKTIMNEYFADVGDEKKEEKEKEETKKEAKESTFQQDYEYILNVMKRDKDD